MTKHPYFYKSLSHIPTEAAKQIWFYVHSVGWFCCDPNYDVKRESFFGYQLKYVLRGKGFIEWEGHTYNAEAGDLFLLDLSQAHRYYADKEDPWELLWVHFGGYGCDDYYHLLGADQSPLMRPVDLTETDAQFRYLFHLFRKRPLGLEALASCAITRILTELVVARAQAGGEVHELHPTPYPDVIRHSMAFLEAHYFEPLQLDDIAQEATLSPFHFARLFKRSTGLSVMEYLLQVRLRMARHLLLQTAMPVSEIAEKCGFSDASYFSRIFKRTHDATPTAYRTRKPDKSDST